MIFVLRVFKEDIEEVQDRRRLPVFLYLILAKIEEYVFSEPFLHSVTI